ncbi:hypothetical protein K7432_006025 [Basidiobolus ranarum]|uniref:Uncharacterized protein n=1 Tax=Basidiobolus ranarum TaxID=34480 RepID=A0ABR2W284_9FUNG
MNSSEQVNWLPIHLLTQIPSSELHPAAEVNDVHQYDKLWCFFNPSHVSESTSRDQTRVNLRICTLEIPPLKSYSIWVTLCHLISGGKLGCCNGRATSSHIILYCDWGEVFKIRWILSNIEDGLLRETKFEVWRLGEFQGSV